MAYALNPDHPAAKLLERAINTSSRDITYRCMKRDRGQGALNRVRQYTKPQLGRDLNVLAGMVKAYCLQTDLPLPQETLVNFSNARELVGKLK